MSSDKGISPVFPFIALAFLASIVSINYFENSVEVAAALEEGIKVGKRFCSAIDTNDCLTLKEKYWKWESGLIAKGVKVISKYHVKANKYYCAMDPLPPRDMEWEWECAKNGWGPLKSKEEKNLLRIVIVALANFSPRVVDIAQT